MARNYDTRVAQALMKAGAVVDNINARSLRPVFKDLIEASDRCIWTKYLFSLQKILRI